MTESAPLSSTTTMQYPLVVALDGTVSLPREILGNKGFGINMMRRHGLPVPPAFCITTQVCTRYFADPETTMRDVWSQVLDKLGWLEQQTRRTFGRGPRPMLVSVRSGAAQSMPGMLDTVLNIGVDDDVENSLAASSTERFARDSRERLHNMYRCTVLGDSRPGQVPDESGEVPEDPYLQLRGAIEAVFRSWNSLRAVAYRDHRGLGDSGGTAALVQAMVFGNMEYRSGTGVLFSRNPMTGESDPFGEWLAGGQGEDVVSGSIDCQPIAALSEAMPDVYDALLVAARHLEALNGDVQDIEFTVEEGHLWLLQTRNAKRSARASVRLALQFREENLIDEYEVLRRVTPVQIQTLLSPALQPETRHAAPLLATGLPACPGVASGRAYTDVDQALDAADHGEDVILVRSATSPDDVAGMLAARGIVTEIGGATSHAAVVSREIGRPTIVGCGTGVAASLEGKLITVDGTEGEVREGILELTAWSEDDSPDLRQLTDIALQNGPLRARAHGNYPPLADGSETAVREAMSAGTADVTSPTPLLTMLTAFHIHDQALQASDG
jgi:pyruvate, orthophosphate dikinase